jgi:hypothetical protein
MEFCSATKKNEILSFTGKRLELENIMLGEVRLKRPKICSPSYVDYRPKTCRNIIGNQSHTKRRLLMGKERKPKT